MNQQALKQKALEISDRFQFKPYSVIVEGMHGGSHAPSVNECTNHLDSDFMTRLENNEHLSPEFMIN